MMKSSKTYPISCPVDPRKISLTILTILSECVELLHVWVSELCELARAKALKPRSELSGPPEAREAGLSLVDIFSLGPLVTTAEWAVDNLEL